MLTIVKHCMIPNDDETKLLKKNFDGHAAKYAYIYEIYCILNIIRYQIHFVSLEKLAFVFILELVTIWT